MFCDTRFVFFFFFFSSHQKLHARMDRFVIRTKRKVAEEMMEVIPAEEGEQPEATTATPTRFHFQPITDRSTPPLSTEAKKSPLHELLEHGQVCCTDKSVESVVQQFDEETRKICGLTYRPLPRPSHTRGVRGGLASPSAFVTKALCHLFEEKKKNEGPPASTGEAWCWHDEHWKRWIASNSYNLSHNPCHLGQCWMYPNPPVSRGDGYVQTAIGSGDRPMLHNVSYLLKHPQDAGLLAGRFSLHPETGLPMSYEGQEQDASLKLEVSHICHIPSCFNPWHLVLEPHWINEDRKGCKYGCPHRCPHAPRCLFDTRF